ncbi:MAG: very short patch repair endonuclease [Planctomycetota bacterium]|jgi:DNA mismatch endonuclease (patch repair protein)
MDRLTKQHRSWNMSRIRGKDTKPELLVRSMLHRLGFRFRLHRKDLPGKPDIVLPAYRTVIFVHGCFWHRHPGCRFAYNPKSRVDFWRAKFRRNVERHQEVEQALEDLGWRVIVIWECETASDEQLEQRICDELYEA